MIEKLRRLLGRPNRYQIKITRYDTFEPYGKMFIVDLSKLCLLIGLIIPCGIEFLIIAIIKRKGWNKEFFRFPIKN